MFWRRRSESNRRSGLCRPVPYHLATPPSFFFAPPRRNRSHTEPETSYAVVAGSEEVPRRLSRVNFADDPGCCSQPRIISGRVGGVKWLALIAGGGLGTLLRTGLTVWIDERFTSPFPWGTLCVNVGGCFLIGVLATLIDEERFASPAVRLFAITGVLGAFTTFSTFGIETWRLFEEGRAAIAIANVMGSVALCLLGVAMGVAVVRGLT